MRSLNREGMAGVNRLSCFGARYKGICDNGLTIRRDEVDARVRKSLQEKLLNQELFEGFCDEFTREMNRLRMEQPASLTAARREVVRIGTRIRKLLNLILDDEIAVDEGRVELKVLDARRKELEAQLKTADEPPALLHPEMARLYSTKGHGAREGTPDAGQPRGGDRGAARTRGRHRVDSSREWGRAPHRVAGQPGRDAQRHRTNEEVVRL